MEGFPHECAEVQASLPLYVGADLEAPAMAAVRAHLGGCAACAASHDAAAAARGALQGLRRYQDRTETGASLWPAIRGRLLVEGLIAPGGASGPEASAARAAPRPRSLASSWRAWSGAAAAAAVLACFALLRERSPVIDDVPLTPEPVVAVEPLPVVATPPDEVAARGPDEDWADVIQPLRLAEPEGMSLYDQAIFGEGQHPLGSTGPTVLTGNPIVVPGLR